MLLVVLFEEDALDGERVDGEGDGQAKCAAKADAADDVVMEEECEPQQ